MRTLLRLRDADVVAVGVLVERLSALHDGEPPPHQAAANGKTDDRFERRAPRAREECRRRESKPADYTHPREIASRDVAASMEQPRETTRTDASAPAVDGSVDGFRAAPSDPSRPPRGDTRARDDVAEDLRRLAAKMRLLERLSSGDERVLATELREELERLAGPSAEVIAFSGLSSRRTT